MPVGRMLKDYIQRFLPISNKNNYFGQTFQEKYVDFSVVFLTTSNKIVIVGRVIIKKG